MKRILAACLGLAVFFGPSRMLALENPMSRLPALRCEIRPNESRTIYFTDRGHNNFHFILFSNRNNLKVFQEWSSWGYYARSFLAVDSSDKTRAYRMVRREGAWTKNFPATYQLNAGEFLITDVNFCDGTWTATPQLPENGPINLLLTGIFEIKADDVTKKDEVWTGRIESEPKEAFIDPVCVKRINQAAPGAN